MDATEPVEVGRDGTDAVGSGGDEPTSDSVATEGAGDTASRTTAMTSFFGRVVFGAGTAGTGGAVGAGAGEGGGITGAIAATVAGTGAGVAGVAGREGTTGAVDTGFLSATGLTAGKGCTEMVDDTCLGCRVVVGLR